MRSFFAGYVIILVFGMISCITIDVEVIDRMVFIFVIVDITIKTHLSLSLLFDCIVNQNHLNNYYLIPRRCWNSVTVVVSYSMVIMLQKC